jgi:hypothetical protein
VKALVLVLLSGCATQLLPEPDAGPVAPDLGGISCSQFLACAEKCVGFDSCVSSCESRARSSSEAMVNVVFTCMDNECTGINIHDCSNPSQAVCDLCIKGRCPNGYEACKHDL